MSRFGSALFAVAFALIALFVVGASLVQAPTDGAGSDRSSALRGLRLRALLGALIASLIVVGWCSGAFAQSSTLGLTGSVEGPVYTRFGAGLTIDLRQSQMVTPSTGYQAFLSYDPAVLRLVTANYTTAPYGRSIITPIQDAGGLIDLACGILPDQQQPSLESAVLASLVFEPLGVEGVTSVVFRNHSPPTRFADDQGNPIETLTIDSPAITIDNTPPSITCPPNIATTNDPGHPYATITVGSAAATDALSGIAGVTGNRSDSAALTDGYPVGITTITWVATDRAGNTATCTQTVTVTDTRPIVVVREDDATRSWMNAYATFNNVSAYDYARANSIPITWGAIFAESDAGRALTWSELRDYVDAAGGEIASHSYNHRQMASAEEYIAELIDSRAAIEAAIPGYQCTTFLQPGSWRAEALLDTFDKYNNPVSQAIKSTYDQSMAYLGQGWAIGSAYYRYGMTASYPLDYPAVLTETSVRTALQVVAETPGVIWVASCHQVQAANGTKTYAVPANILKAFIDELVSLRQAGKIRLMSLRQAFSTPLPADLNRVPDPGFDIAPAADPSGYTPWRLLSNSHISQSDGVGGSRCLSLDGTGARVQSALLLLEPGQYELSWYQKAQPGYPPGPWLDLVVNNFEGFSWNHSRPLANHVYYPNSDPGSWEKKAAMLRVKEYLPNVIAEFWAGKGYLVDNVSLVSKPVDPAVSPGNVVLSPTPSGCNVAWDTPPDQSITKVAIRYSGQSSPSTGTSGNGGQASAVPGTRQQAFYPINWSSYTVAYFSLFARIGNQYLEPTVDYVLVDKTGPYFSNLSAVRTSSSVISATWDVADADSGVSAVQYGLGSTPYFPDLQPWKNANGNSATLNGVPAGADVHLLVKGQNLFGFWCPTTSFLVRAVPGSITDALSTPNGTFVTVIGTVSAIFGDCCYVEHTDRVRGIRVNGFSGAQEGQEVQISGMMTTVNGERAVNAQ